LPAGFGAIPAKLASGLARVPVDAQQASNGLTRSAILGVVALARSQGHPIATPSMSSSSSSSSPPALLVLGLPAALLVLAGLFVTRRRTRPAAHPGEGEED
jgi:LPXTG-motif cell wall-anchored protein